MTTKWNCAPGWRRGSSINREGWGFRAGIVVRSRRFDLPWNVAASQLHSIGFQESPARRQALGRGQQIQNLSPAIATQWLGTGRVGSGRLVGPIALDQLLDAVLNHFAVLKAQAAFHSREPSVLQIGQNHAEHPNVIPARP